MKLKRPRENPNYWNARPDKDTALSHIWAQAWIWNYRFQDLIYAIQNENKPIYFLGPQLLFDF